MDQGMYYAAFTFRTKPDTRPARVRGQVESFPTAREKQLSRHHSFHVNQGRLPSS